MTNISGKTGNESRPGAGSHTPAPSDADDLRRQAEERLSDSEKQKSLWSEGGDQSPAKDTARLVHELQVHQIELEMQNEELRKARAAADALLAQYTDLYDFAPTGYLTLDREGTIRQVNLTGALLLGVERSRLVNRRFGLFVAESDRRAFSEFVEKVFASEGEKRGGDWTFDAGGNGKESCEVTLSRDGSPPFVVRIEGTRSTDGQECRAVVLDITERKRAEDGLKRSFQSLQDSLTGTIQAMASVVGFRDPYTAGHQRQVAELAQAIASEMRLPTHQAEGLRMAAAIHDLGKIAVPAEILSKPMKLSKLEFELIKVHPQAAYNILKSIAFPWPIARIILEHHEKMDGSGYPQGLKGDAILLESRIIAVADVVEAMASHRPYRSALGIGAALEEIEKNKGLLYDADVVSACLALFREKMFCFEKNPDA